MTNDRSLFVDGEFITLTNYAIITAGGHIAATSIRNTRFNLLDKSGTTTEIVLKNCPFILSLFTNLISLRKLANNKVYFNTID